jgi:Cys-tRNA(Pro)/Cys-tRNA(Cys) deacylase
VHPNIEQVLREHPVEYTVHRHEAFSAPIHSPADFAAELGYELGRITKTLLVRSTAGGDAHGLVVAPMGKKIDFRAVAGLLGVRRVEVAPASDLLSLTGYPEKGVSPLGVKNLRVFMDEALFQFQTILVGAGAVGVEIELRPADLAAITGAQRAALAIS